MAECPEDLERLVLSLLAKDPSERPFSAVEVEQKLYHCQDYGGWSVEQAEQWWTRHGPDLGLSDAESDRAPLGETQKLIRRGRSR